MCVHMLGKIQHRDDVSTWVHSHPAIATIDQGLNYSSPATFFIHAKVCTLALLLSMGSTRQT